MISNKKHPIVTELFKKPDISLVFITQSYFWASKDLRINTTHFLIMKVSNKQELQQTVTNHSSAIDFDEFESLFRKFAAKLYAFLVINTTLTSDNALCF